MIKVGLTGGIGSGKSYVAKIFSALGIPVYNSDLEAKKLYYREDVHRLMIKNFGNEVYLKSGDINKTYLANIIFNDKDALEKINSIIHPLVKEHFNRWIKENRQADYIIKEAAILFESGAYKDMHKIIAVTSPINLRIERVIKRDKSNREEILKKINNQLSDEELIERCDFHILNNGKALLPQVLKIHNTLLKLNKTINPQAIR
ncbi:MAG: dephospho-CoA kinase [Bacteroidales bacterium]|nr:dephospho-CoA kinase [Bacteroidales bacterium]